MNKIDCSIAVNYIKEKARLTENCTISCGACMLGASNTGENMECYVFENNMPEKAVEIIQEWSNEIPVKTRLDDFKEKYPKHRTHVTDSMPCVCCMNLGYTDECPIKTCKTCKNCWDMPV